jgi:hypothetical protein
MLLPACGARDLSGEVQPLSGLTLSLRVNGEPVAVGAFLSGMVIVKTGDHYGWLTGRYDIGEVTIRETMVKVSGQAADTTTSVIAINPAGSQDFIWNLTYGAAPAVSLSG